jgi:transcriptional regulator with XRE-family HTH domain
MSGLVSYQDRDLRVRVNDALQRYGIKQVDLARETGIHHSTLSLWLQGKLKGGSIKNEEQIENWLNNLYSNKPRISGSSYTRLELLKGKRERGKLNDNFDNNNGFGNLIPININIELEGKKFKEIFFWELNEPYLKIENFARILVEDNQLPTSFENEIIK